MVHLVLKLPTVLYVNRSTWQKRGPWCLQAQPGDYWMNQVTSERASSNSCDGHNTFPVNVVSRVAITISTMTIFRHGICHILIKMGSLMKSKYMLHEMASPMRHGCPSSTLYLSLLFLCEVYNKSRMSERSTIWEGENNLSNQPQLTWSEE